MANTEFVAIAAGSSHSLGLKADGSIVAWGDNEYGQCDVPSPNSGFVAIAAGSSHSLGLKADGSIVAWGRNEFGQCNVPQPNAGFREIAASSSHSVAIKDACDKDLAGDIWLDCRVDREDLLLLTEGWMTSECEEPEWCGGADLTRDGHVGIEDLAVMAEEWMK